VAAEVLDADDVTFPRSVPAAAKPYSQVIPLHTTFHFEFCPVNVPLWVPEIQWISREPFVTVVVVQVQLPQSSVVILPVTVLVDPPVVEVLNLIVEPEHVSSIGPETQ
jgi:hypothetical protein